MRTHDGFSSYVKNIYATIRSMASSPFMQTAVILPPAVTVISIAILGWFMRSLPPQVPLYYSRPWGEEQLASQAFLFLLPGGSFLWYLVSILFVHHLAHHYRVFSQILLVIQATCSLLALFIVLNVLRLML
jgi:hypothetical protein